MDSNIEILASNPNHVIGMSDLVDLWVIKEALGINALRACVSIYIRQLSSLRAPTLWLIDLTVATCHIKDTFLSFCQFFSRENGQNTKILEVRHFHMKRKWPPTVTRRAKHWYWESLWSFAHVVRRDHVNSARHADHEEHSVKTFMRCAKFYGLLFLDSDWLGRQTQITWYLPMNEKAMFDQQERRGVQKKSKCTDLVQNNKLQTIKLQPGHSRVHINLRNPYHLSHRKGHAQLLPVVERKQNKLL